MSLINVVYDTNILISAILSIKGSPFKVIELAKTGAVQSVTCKDIIDEFREKLVDKFEFSDDKADKALMEFRKISQMVIVPHKLKGIVIDPDDDVVIECAVIGNADYIVTGDKHLLRLKKYEDIEILKANEFFNRFL